jgi:hypothetical protein
LDGAKVIARDGGIDVLANRYLPGVLARRGLVQQTPPFVTWQGAPFELLPGVVSGTVATANGDELEICHHQYNGDASSFSSFSGAYARVSGPATLFDGSSCEGIAYRGERGLLAIHKRAADGRCCSRPVVFELNHDSLVSRQEELALPEGQFGDIRMSAYAGGFAWAGFIDDNGSRALHVRFRTDAGTVAHNLPAPGAGERPDVASWPFDDAVAVTWSVGDGMKLAVVDSAGTLLVDEDISPAPGEHIQRAPVDTSAHGLVAAYARCAADFSDSAGQLIAELRRAGEPTQRVAVPVKCHAFVQSIAVVGDVIFVLFARDDDIEGVILRIAT